jgi:hypothetical protein
MKIDRHNVSGSLTGSRVLSRELKYYYDNRDERLRYQGEYYASKRDYINAKRRERYAKDESAKLKKREIEAARYMKNRVKIALRRAEKSAITRALKEAESGTAQANAGKKRANRS